MRKIALFLAIVMMASSCYAQGYTANASPIIVGVNNNATSQGYELGFNARNIKVSNYDDTAYVYINFKSSTDTDINKGYLLGPADQIELFNFAMDKFIVIYDDGVYSNDTEASPISIMPTH